MNARSVALFGHTAALQAIERALTAARARRGGVLFITGESGIGKSRLAAEAIARGSSTGMSVLRGRGSSTGPSVPYRPLTEALLAVARAGHPGLSDAIGPYQPVLGRLIPDWSNGIPSAGPISPVVLGEGVLRLTSALGQLAGCLFILDDLHDADAETLAVTEYLFDNVADQPILFLAAMRDQPSPAFELVQSAVRRGSGTVLRLERFSRSEVTGFAAACLGTGSDLVPSAAVDQLWAASAGHPLVVQELLDNMLRSDTLHFTDGAWRMAALGPAGAAVPTGLGRLVAGKVDTLDPAARSTLKIAAVFGDRFPVAVVGAAAGLPESALLEHLKTAAMAELVLTDESETGWYRFRHPLTARALLAQSLPSERAELAGTAAAAIAALFPGVPGQWCQLAAVLRAESGDAAAAADLFATAGRRAQAAGAATSAVAAFERSMSLMNGAASATRLAVQEDLLYALADAGEVEQALSNVESLAEPVDTAARIRRAALRTRLAWAANLAGSHEAGLAQVAAARAVLGPGAADEHTAPIDSVAAQLIAEHPDRDSYAAAHAMARRAAAIGQRVPLPEIACESLRLIGSLIRRDDADEANACFEQAYAIALEHQLPGHAVKALFHLGADDSLRDGNIARLQRARDEAQRIGAVTDSYLAESSIALQQVLFGDLAAAAETCERIWPSLARLRLAETAQFTLLARATLAAHRGRRSEMDRVLAELRRWGGDRSQYPPVVMGLARAFCALLEEDQARALSELDRADRWEDEHSSHYQLTGRYGVGVLLRVLRGDAGLRECEAAGDSSPGRARWNRQFLQLALAVAQGRAGRTEAAQAAALTALTAGQVYPMARHLSFRLVAEAALDDGWGAPVAWLRDAESYFFEAGVAPVASACRAILRHAGEHVPQRRRGVERVPASLRSLGITVREFEVLQLLGGRQGNRSIASRLHISPRTVEKHVANLIAKTGFTDRNALGEYAAQTLA